ncbi:AMP-binding enzyme domain-containing protein [Pochonia chlamydosporia 170]|uniref:AMP-binding enzyme domain-containing protein n=1 Tax=Pochonia chlamydosporia 170 TaxID=1380566 RepID=A0A179FL56_METCM|nr:AMP-binding enzyme domain-containing protein [Pochonia chlamydosporia 170]OAQ65773.1 AMP-binding enzyme domain-containing protein [Pochonia chlamydosporia 170]
MPIKSPWTVNVPVTDIWSLLFDTPKEYPGDHVLFVDDDTGRSYTFNDTLKKGIAFGQGLKQLFNWQKGDVLGIYSPNDIDIPVVVKARTHYTG